MELELQSALKRLIQSRNLLPVGSRVIIAVSGGVDSLVLLHILDRLKEDLTIQLHVATLDHGLRGDAGAEDARFVEHTAHEWGISCTRGYADVPTLAAEWKLGNEAAARRARYDFLKFTADQYGAQHIAVAHNADDQAETVLMHLIRGSGVRGLGGMALSTMQQGSGVKFHMIVRPLLETSRANIEAYAREHNLAPRIDATNDDTKYLRNRIRHELIPLLKTYNPHVVQAIGRLTDIVIEDSTSHPGVSAFMGDARRDGRLIVPREKFIRGSRANQRQALFRAYSELNELDAAQITYDHIERALTFIQAAKTGDIYQLPGRIHLRIEYERVLLEREYAPEVFHHPLLHGSPVTLDLDGGVYLFVLSRHQFRYYPAFSRFRASVSLLESASIQARLAIPADASLALRTRQSRDTFQPLGMNGHTKSIREWMIDHKVPAQFRDRVPLLLVNDQIAAIIWGDQWAIDHRFAVQGAPDEHILYFKIEQIAE